MAKAKAGQFDHIEDPELREKLEKLAANHAEAKAAVESSKDADGRPRYCFSRATTERHPGAMVKVRNGLDEQARGGRVIEPVGAAYRVQVDDLELIVHEPDDTWQ